MSSSTSEGIKRLFELESMNREAKLMLKGHQWQAFNAITESFAKQRAYEQQKYKSEYQTRVEIVLKRLTDKAGSKGRDFKLRWAGSDNFDADANKRQAQRIVRGRHEKLMNGINDFEQRAKDEFLDRCQHRQQQRDKTLRDFGRAVDRRDGQDRRKSQTRHQTR